MLAGLYRWLTASAIILITVIPEWGLAAWAWKLFPDYPVLVGIASLLWVIVLSLILPLTLKIFQIVSTVAMVGILCILDWQMRQNTPSLFVGNTWYFEAAVILAIPIGWLMVSTSLWRWVRGIVVTQDTSAHHN